MPPRPAESTEADRQPASLDTNFPALEGHLLSQEERRFIDDVLRRATSVLPWSDPRAQVDLARLDPRPHPLAMVRLILREAFARRRVRRTPESDALFQDGARALVFHRTGSVTLPPVDHLNAIFLSRLAPRHGLVLDLGCGTGRGLLHLARCRTDLTLIGLDVAHPMLSIAWREALATGLRQRVTFRVGDLRDWADRTPERPDVISAVFALHALPNFNDLVASFRRLAWAQRVWGSAVWIFDFARPKAEATCATYSRIFLRGAPDLHHDTTERALRAAWTPAEIEEAARRAGLRLDGGGPSHGMPLFQAWWAGPAMGRDLAPSAMASLSPQARANVRLLKILLAGRGPHASHI